MACSPLLELQKVLLYSKRGVDVRSEDECGGVCTATEVGLDARHKRLNSCARVQRVVYPLANGMAVGYPKCKD